MAKKKFKKIFTYECTLTGETFKTTREAPSAEDLVSVRGYYELNPDQDDRPEYIKIKLLQEQEDIPTPE